MSVEFVSTMSLEYCVSYVSERFTCGGLGSLVTGCRNSKTRTPPVFAPYPAKAKGTSKGPLAAPATAPPTAKATVLANTHQPAREICRRITSHCAIPSEAPSTAQSTALSRVPPRTSEDALKITKTNTTTATNPPTAKPTMLANTHQSQKPHPTCARSASLVINLLLARLLALPAGAQKAAA